MYPRIVRQIEFIGSVGALGTAGVAFALSKSINCSCSWQRPGCRANQVSRQLDVPEHDAVRAHVRPQRLRNHHTAVGLLIILDERHPSATHRQGTAI